MPALVSPDIRTEWMTFRRYITRQPKEDTMKLLKELATNSMLVEMFPPKKNHGRVTRLTSCHRR